MAQNLDSPGHTIAQRSILRPASIRRLVGLLIGIVAGLAIGQLSVGFPTNSNGSPISGLGAFPAPLGDSQGARDEAPLDLVGMEVTKSGEYRLVSGSLNGLLTEKPLRTGDWDTVSMDQSGQWLALSEKSPDGNGLLLVGSGSTLTPLSTTATSFAWHDSKPGTLSFVERTPQGGWKLSVTEMGGETRVIVSGDGVLGDVAAWGEWGWAIQTSNDSITILDGSGQEWERAHGLALDSHPTGWILTIHPAGLNVVVPGGGVVYLEIDHDTIGGVGAASLSPDRKKIILVGPRGVKITDINSERPATTMPLSSLPRATAWSSESRYALIAQQKGILVVDTTGADPAVSHAWQERSLLTLVSRQ